MSGEDKIPTLSRARLQGSDVQNNGFSLMIMEKAMATHSSTLAWKTPWAEEPGRLQSRVAKSWT